MNILINHSPHPDPDDRPSEIVERKGIGHPDTISDALAEAFSLALSRYYLEHFNMILHHNVDKVLLWGGAAEPRFGGGETTAPIEIYLAGRAVTRWKGVDIPVAELAVASCRQWLTEHIRYLDAERDVKLHYLVRPGSMDLEELFLRQKKGVAPPANDTSCGVGFAPLSELENIVYQLERSLNSPRFKEQHPEAGEDIKIMGVRNADAIRLTIGCAMVDRHIKDMIDYLAKKALIAEAAEKLASGLTRRDVSVDVNTADDPERDSVYLTVTGTSSEAGDDGEAGRGNRANGLITPGRPMTMESVAGKNPVTHVGKIYNVAAGIMANAIAAALELPGGVEVALVSQIGKPIDQPQICEITLPGAFEAPSASEKHQIDEIAREILNQIPNMWRDFVEGRIAIDAWPHISA